MMKLSDLVDMLINTLIRSGPLKYKPWQTERRAREIIERVIGPTFAQLEAENEALKGWIEKHGRHSYFCNVRSLLKETDMHTKGPWTLNYVGTPNDLWILDGKDKAYLADIYGAHGPEDAITHEEGEANARLIASAPELLEALQTIAKHDGCDNFVAKHLVAIATEAIHKAKEKK